jgi:hypothetical protein
VGKATAYMGGRRGKQILTGKYYTTCGVNDLPEDAIMCSRKQNLQ